MQNLNKQAGISILGILFLAVIVLLVLSYFNISIKAVVESPTGQENVNYVKGSTQSVWTTYLEKPVAHFWNDIWLPLFWDPFVSNMQKIKNGQPNDLNNSSPQVNFQ